MWKGRRLRRQALIATASFAATLWVYYTFIEPRAPTTSTKSASSALAVNSWLTELAQTHPFAAHGYRTNPAEQRSDANSDSSSFERTAFVSFAAGDESARMVVSWLQSLRDVQTKVPTILIMLGIGGVGSDDCHNETWRKLHNKPNGCHSNEPNEIISQRYLDVIYRLGAQTVIVEPFPQTPFIGCIPGGGGGSQTFWGMSLNKLRVFNMTQFRKIVFMDADTLVLRNIDHLMFEPTFSAPSTFACRNRASPARISGGFWVLEPSLKVGELIWKLMHQPYPYKERNQSGGECWLLSDMMFVRHIFERPEVNYRHYQFPLTGDRLNGFVPGTTLISRYANLSEWEYNNTFRDKWSGEIRREGFLRDKLGDDDESMVWHILGLQYDALVGNCEDLPERDLREQLYTIHFACSSYIAKPGRYATEREFMEAVMHGALSCSRYYYLRWFDTLQRAGIQLPVPYSGPPVPVEDTELDKQIIARREAEMRATLEAEAKARAQQQPP